MMKEKRWQEIVDYFAKHEQLPELDEMEYVKIEDKRQRGNMRIYILTAPHQDFAWRAKVIFEGKKCTYKHTWRYWTIGYDAYLARGWEDEEDED